MYIYNRVWQYLIISIVLQWGFLSLWLICCVPLCVMLYSVKGRRILRQILCNNHMIALTQQVLMLQLVHVVETVHLKCAFVNERLSGKKGVHYVTFKVGVSSVGAL